MLIIKVKTLLPRLKHFALQTRVPLMGSHVTAVNTSPMALLTIQSTVPAGCQDMLAH